MSLDLLFPEDEQQPDPDALSRFARGIASEDAVVATLMQVGPRCDPPFRVAEGQRRIEVRDDDGTLLVTGKLDGRLSFGHGAPKPLTS